jgi:hypothetical protein
MNVIAANIRRTPTGEGDVHISGSGASQEFTSLRGSAMRSA